MIMNDSPIQEIKNKLDIVDVIREYVNLEKAGSNYRAICPFHHEKTPSFFVSQPRQIWRCFGGCNDGGDMFKFIMRIEGVEFGDALRLLAKKAGVELKKQNPEIETKRKRLIDICELSTVFFEKQLQQSKKGEEVINYLLERKITKESIKEWRIGYAPTAKDALSQFLIGEGYKKEEIIEAGVSAGKGNYVFDRFRGRIIFPIFNLNSQPIGFGGRVFFKKDTRSKYINTPATILYDKSAVMYGMNNAKTDIRKEEKVIIVEGYTDVILCHQAGFKNVVSASGTALTTRQLDMLGRYTKKILTAFDMDAAGNSATKKGIDIALDKGFDVRVIIMPDKKDPADVVSENKEEWGEYVKGAKPVINFYFKSVLSRYDLSNPHEKGEAGKELLPEIKKLKNSIERAYFVSELSRILGVSEDSVYEEMEKIKLEEASKEEKTENVSNIIEKEYKNKTRKELLEERIASFCVKEPVFLDKLKEGDAGLLSKEICNILSFLKKEKETLTIEEESFLDYLSLFPFPENEEENKEKEFEKCIKEIKQENIKIKLKETEEEIKKAEERGDEEKIEELIKNFRDYSKELRALQNNIH
jgi:DNA primase